MCGLQLFYILGIDMSGVMLATCMQPSIPVITVLLGVLFGLEAGSLQKFAGILLAVAGAVCMVSLHNVSRQGRLKGHNELGSFAGQCASLLGGVPSSLTVVTRRMQTGRFSALHRCWEACSKAMPRAVAAAATTCCSAAYASLPTPSAWCAWLCIQSAACDCLHPCKADVPPSSLCNSQPLCVTYLSQALYYILAKHLVGKYNPVCIAAWAYIVAASLMGATAVVTVQRTEWIVPPAMFGPLIYW